MDFIKKIVLIVLVTSLGAGLGFLSTQITKRYYNGGIAVTYESILKKHSVQSVGGHLSKLTPEGLEKFKAEWKTKPEELVAYEKVQTIKKTLKEKDLYSKLETIREELGVTNVSKYISVLGLVNPAEEAEVPEEEATDSEPVLSGSEQKAKLLEKWGVTEDDLVEAENYEDRGLVFATHPNPFYFSLILGFLAFIYSLFKTLPNPDRFKLVKVKFPVTFILSCIIPPLMGYMKFPGWWQIEFVAFAMIGLACFIILDLKPMKLESGGGHTLVRLLGTYALPSFLFIVITAQLPQYTTQHELAKLNKPPIILSGLAGPEVIAAGRDVFESNKCFNCHKVFWEGNSDRGPNLGSKQIGLYSEDYIKDQILNPRNNQSPGYEDKKSKRAMPTYYDEDLSEDELSALVSYLKTLRDPTHMPVEGKFPNQWTWWDDPDIIAEGKVVFEGKEPFTEGLNCAVCHGADGIPMMTGAFDFRNPDNLDTDKMADHRPLKLKDWPDDLYYRRVTRGVDGTAMAPWGMIFPHLYLWKAEAYSRTFHDPLDKRTEKKPVPPVPTKEEIERWKTEGLFLDPLL